MSRIASQPVSIPSGVAVKLEQNNVVITGDCGELSLKTHGDVRVTKTLENTLKVEPATTDDAARVLAGVTRALLANNIYGVNQGWNKTLELVGVGYRATVAGDELTLTIGFSHPVKIKAPRGITFSTNENKITVKGADRQQVGELAAKIRRLRPPEPYKGKGIRYVGEIIRKKAGKAAKAVGGTAGAAAK